MRSIEIHKQIPGREEVGSGVGGAGWVEVGVRGAKYSGCHRSDQLRYIRYREEKGLGVGLGLLVGSDRDKVQ